MSKLIKPDDARVFQSAEKFEKDPFRLDHLLLPEEDIQEGAPPEDQPMTLDPTALGHMVDETLFR